MDLWQLRIFCKVVELKSFSRAARAVHLSQPTVSSHIRDLEEHFGARLLDRLSREALPTRAGELLYDQARKMLALKEETENALAEFQGVIRGRLIIGGSTIPGVYLLPPAIGRFLAEHPDVRVSLIIGDTARIADETAAGGVDLGVVGARTGDARLRQEKLAEDTLHLVAPANHPWGKRETVSLAELLTAPFILREPGSGTRETLRRLLADAGHKLEDLRVVAEMGSTQAVIQGVKCGLGVSILSGIAVTDLVAAGLLRTIPIVGIPLKRRFYITLHKDRSLSPPARAFIAFLKKDV